MKKQDLIERVAETAELDKRAAEGAVEAVLSTITEALRSGDEVSLFKFGTFSVKQNAARTGRNPQTGAAVKIAASKSLKFKAASTWKETLNAKTTAKKAPAKSAAKATKAPAKAAATKATATKATAAKAAPAKAAPAKKAAAKKKA